MNKEKFMEKQYVILTEKLIPINCCDLQCMNFTLVIFINCINFSKIIN